MHTQSKREYGDFVCSSCDEEKVNSELATIDTAGNGTCDSCQKELEAEYNFDMAHRRSMSDTARFI